MKTKNENVDAKISAQLLGPSTSSHGNDPFGRPQSSHSFFNETPYRYNKVPLNMSSKLWSKRDSLVRKKKKAVRINAIPSSAGSTPLTTPHQSHRGKLSDDEDDDDELIMYDEDPHQKYLQMMGSKDGKQTMINKVQQPVQSTRNKLTDKATIHDLFDMLQQQTLAPSSPISTSTATSSSSSSLNDVRSLFDSHPLQQHNAHQQQQSDSTDAMLVPLCDSSTDSDSSAD